MRAKSAPEKIYGGRAVNSGLEKTRSGYILQGTQKSCQRLKVRKKRWRKDVLHQTSELLGGESTVEILRARSRAMKFQLKVRVRTKRNEESDER
jgi:hypothetical protein